MAERTASLNQNGLVEYASYSMILECWKSSTNICSTSLLNSGSTTMAVISKFRRNERFSKFAVPLPDHIAKNGPHSPNHHVSVPVSSQCLPDHRSSCSSSDGAPFPRVDIVPSSAQDVIISNSMVVSRVSATDFKLTSLLVLGLTATPQL